MMISANEQIWSAILAAIPDVEPWNANLGEFKRLTEEYGPECRAYILAEAERRGYLWSKVSKCYFHPWEMRACKGNNLIGCGWRSGQLAVVFASKDGPRRYESVSHELPIEIANKLVNSPNPDALFVKLVKNKGIQMVKVG